MTKYKKVRLSFCPTGQGGGIDNSCGKGSGGGGTMKEAQFIDNTKDIRAQLAAGGSVQGVMDADGQFAIWAGSKMSKDDMLKDAELDNDPDSRSFVATADKLTFEDGEKIEGKEAVESALTGADMEI